MALAPMRKATRARAPSPTPVTTASGRSRPLLLPAMPEPPRSGGDGATGVPDGGADRVPEDAAEAVRSGRGSSGGSRGGSNSADEEDPSGPSSKNAATAASSWSPTGCWDSWSSGTSSDHRGASSRPVQGSAEGKPPVTSADGSVQWGNSSSGDSPPNTERPGSATSSGESRPRILISSKPWSPLPFCSFTPGLPS